MVPSRCVWRRLKWQITSFDHYGEMVDCRAVLCAISDRERRCEDHQRGEKTRLHAGGACWSRSGSDGRSRHNFPERAFFEKA